MPMKILVIENPNFKPSSPSWAAATALELGKIPAYLKNEILAGTSALLLAPESLRKDPQMLGLLDAGYAISCLFFRDQSQADQFGERLNFLADENRSSGVKSSLTKGSTIYSETFFDAGKVGERLDRVFRFARQKLDPQKGLEAWGALQSLLFLGIHALPAQGEKGTGERVDVQVGADADRLAFTIRFDLPPENWIQIREHALLELPRSSIDFFEFRYLQSEKKAEFLGLHFVGEKMNGAIEAVSFHHAAATEGAGDAKDYNFQTFGSLSGSNPKAQRVIKGGFKKKFSEQVKIAAGEATEADAENIHVSGDALQPNATVVVSGSAGLGKTEAASAPSAPAAVSVEKSKALLESKIQGLEETLKQREELVAKLNKEIEEIKDPSKMGVITGIKDNQLQGLKDNITRLQAEITDAQGREKELLAVVDKSVQMKDEALKRNKELEIKVKQSSEGNNSKILTLEKQIDEHKRKNQELTKKISQLVEQITGAGMKVAA